MAISEDTSALVAAQLTAAWASRMGEAAAADAGTAGPEILAVYRKFVADFQAEATANAEANTAAWIETYKAT